MNKIPAVIFLVCIAIYGTAQQPVFRNYSTADGLPSSETYNIMQSSKGYMYIGTDRGIGRFDGYGFTAITSTGGLPDNTVFLLNEDKSQRIWYVTFSGKIGYLYKDSAYTYQYNAVLNSILAAKGAMVQMIYDDGENTWFGLRAGATGKIVVIKKNGFVDSITLPPNDSSKYVYVTDTKMGLLAGNLASKNIRFISLKTREIIQDISSASNNIIVSGDIVFFHQSANGDKWMCTNGEVYRKRNNTCTKIISSNIKEKVLSMVVDKNDNVWVGYHYKGLLLYKKSDNYASPTHLLADYSISCIGEDKEGGLWFTTLENGIYYLPPDFLISYNEKSSFRIAKVLKVKNINDNPAVILSDFRLLLKKGEGEKTVWKNPTSTSRVLDIEMLAPNTLYYSCFDTTLLTFEGHKTINLEGNEYLATKNYIWAFGGSHLFYYDYNGKEIGKSTVFSKIARITSLFENKKGVLMVGTLQGLYEYKNNNAFPLKSIHPFLGSRITDIQRLDASRLLIATMGNGLLVFDEDNYRVLNTFSVADGLPSMMCHLVVCEGDSVVWVGTNTGLCKITYIKDAARRRFYKADINDGIISNEINDICIIGNNLWLGTAGGLTVFPKNKVLEYTISIPVLIEKITVNGENWENRPGMFNYWQNNISINFTGISFHHAGNLQYKYRLKGNNEKWSYTTNRNIIYNTLPPGDYIFECFAIAPNQTENQQITTYAFSIRPPFWQKWWFIALSGLAVILALYLFIYFRIRFVRAQDELKADLNRFRDKALRDHVNPHFIYNSLNSIQNFILKNDAMTSASFLSKFSRLMRLIFNNASHDRVPLDEDLESLKLYAELENLRFRNKFTLHIEKDLQDKGRIAIPPLIIQPFVENAILHGLLTKQGPGNIWVKIVQDEKRLKVSITDDGIGRQQAGEIQTRKARYRERGVSGKGRNSSGIQATLDRINQVWGKNSGKSEFKIVDLCDENKVPTGTVIQFYLPITYD